MNTRDFILVGAGAVVGYLLVGVINKKKPVSNETTSEISLPNKSSQTLPPATTESSEEKFIDPNLVICKENWVRFSKNKRFRSEEERQSTYDKFISNCLIRP